MPQRLSVPIYRFYWSKIGLLLLSYLALGVVLVTRLLATGST